MKSEKREKNERKVDLPLTENGKKKRFWENERRNGNLVLILEISTKFSGREFRIPYRSYDLMNLKDGRKKIREKRDRKSREKRVQE